MKFLALAIKNFERYLAIIFTVLFVALLFLQVLSRYVFKLPLNWTEELAVICFIISVYSGACLAVTRRQHLRVQILHTIVSAKKRKILDLFANICFIFAMLVVSKGMLVVTSNLLKYNSVYVATQIPKFIIYGSVWLLFYVMVVRLLQDSWLLIKEYKAIDSEKQPESI